MVSLQGDTALHRCDECKSAFICRKQGRSIGSHGLSQTSSLPLRSLPESLEIFMIEIALSLFLFITLTTLVYAHVGFDNILKSYRMWFEEGYWVNYNVVEAIAWIAKAAVIIPGLVWQREIWQLHVVTLLTSALLIWVSERKLLPTMVAFNTLWIGLSSVVIARNLL